MSQITNMVMGFELEVGATSEDDADRACPAGWTTGADGSIESDYDGVEFKSKPSRKAMELVNGFKRISEVIEEINDTMGLHIHVSFPKKGPYYRLCSWDFVTFFQKQYKETFLSNLEQSRMKNSFCMFYPSKKDFLDAVDEQLGCDDKNTKRYYAVNYNAYSLYKTIEFRIFPATRDIKKFREYMAFTRKTIKEFLKKNRNVTNRSHLDLEVEEENKTITDEITIRKEEVIEV